MPSHPVVPRSEEELRATIDSIISQMRSDREELRLINSELEANLGKLTEAADRLEKALPALMARFKATKTKNQVPVWCNRDFCLEYLRDPEQSRAGIYFAFTRGMCSQRKEYWKKVITGTQELSEDDIAEFHKWFSNYSPQVNEPLNGPR